MDGGITDANTLININGVKLFWVIVLGKSVDSFQKRFSVASKQELFFPLF